MNKSRLWIFIAAAAATPIVGHAQENYKDVRTVNECKDAERHTVRTYTAEETAFDGRPRNVILMIGDGMGVSQVFSGITANGGMLNLCNMKHIGFSKTQSASNYVTDSAAGGTAISCGTKTYNGAIGMGPDTTAIPTILEISDKNGKATGLVATSTIVHATPGSFIGHVKNRSDYEGIALSFLDTDIDVFIGGGKHFFTDRADKRNLFDELERKGYRIYESIDAARGDDRPHMGIITAWEHMAKASERGNILEEATQKAIDVLKADKNGFFMMVEGSQIDWGGHHNDTELLVGEILDFDKAIGKALEFAVADRNTLVVVTADHETGGFANVGGDKESGLVKGGFCTGNHTATMVPVFAFGPGAEQFQGIYENTEIFNKIKELCGLK